MFKRSYIVLILFMVISSYPMYGQAVDEYTLKAIWIGKFTHFIDWPNNTDTTMAYCTIATYNNPFENKLEEIYKSHEIWGKPVKIIHLSKIDDSSKYQILYIPPLKKEEVLKLIGKSKNERILLIGDTKGYAEMGVHINFFLDEKRIRFEINETALRNSNFFVSYRLLNIAKIVEPVVNK